MKLTFLACTLSQNKKVLQQLLFWNFLFLLRPFWSCISINLILQDVPLQISSQLASWAVAQIWKKKFNKKRWTKKLCLYTNYYNLCLLIPTNLYNFFSVTVLKEKLHDYQVKFLNDVRHSSLSFIICVLVFFSFYFTLDVSCLNPPMLCWLLISPNSMKDIGKGHGNIHFLHLNISKYFNTWQS